MRAVLFPAYTASLILGSYYLLCKRSIVTRLVGGTISCAGLICFSKGLPSQSLTTFITCSSYWLVSFRVFSFILLPDGLREQVPLLSYLGSFGWIALPAYRRKDLPRPLKPLLKSAAYFASWAAVKIVLSHFVYDLSVNSLRALGGSEKLRGNTLLALEFSFLQLVLTFSGGTWINDLQIALMPLLSGDRYNVLEVHHYPAFATSLRDFWGRRLNRLTGTMLREAVFDPLRLHGYSTLCASMSTFLVSAVFHAHLTWMTWGPRAGLSSFTFFALNGIACCLEHRYMRCNLPPLAGMLMVQAFLFASSYAVPSEILFTASKWLVDTQPIVRTAALIPLPPPASRPSASILAGLWSLSQTMGALLFHPHSRGIVN